MVNRADVLRKRIASARGLVRNYFEVPDCVWQGRYHHDQAACQKCADGAVCEWIFAQDPDPDLSAFSLAQLEDAHVFAVGFLEGRMVDAGHETNTCSCEMCTWIRTALAEFTAL